MELMEIRRFSLLSYFVIQTVNYTRFEWRRCETSLVSSGEDVKLHSFRVDKMSNYTRLERRRCETALVSSGEDVKLHSFRAEKMKNYTRFEWRRSGFFETTTKVCLPLKCLIDEVPANVFTNAVLKIPSTEPVLHGQSVCILGNLQSYCTW